MKLIVWMRYAWPFMMWSEIDHVDGSRPQGCIKYRSISFKWLKVDNIIDANAKGWTWSTWMRLDNLELTAYMTLIMTWRKYFHLNDTNLGYAALCALCMVFFSKRWKNSWHFAEYALNDTNEADHMDEIWWHGVDGWNWSHRPCCPYGWNLSNVNKGNFHQ